jgi:pantetheine-phosphate adenylyltransferase
MKERSYPVVDYRHAVYAGSFDPVTFGQTAIIQRAARLYENVSVAIGINPNKKGLFTFEERKALLEAALADVKNVRVERFEGLLIDYCHSIGAGVIVRGLRVLTDFEYELQLGMANRDLAPDLETVFMFTESAHVYISSSLVKEIAMNGGDFTRYVPAPVVSALKAKFRI